MHIKPIRHLRLVLVLALSGVLATSAAQAGRHGTMERGVDDDRHDHERARHALDRGEVRPIAEILQAVAAEVPGDVVEVEFERGRCAAPACWVYELKVIDPDGRVLEVMVDASTARILSVEED